MQVNTREETSILYTYTDCTGVSVDLREYVIGRNVDYLANARRLIESGHANVRIERRRVTWRGKNGKPKYETLEVIPVSPAPRVEMTKAGPQALLPGIEPTPAKRGNDAQTRMW